MYLKEVELSDIQSVVDVHNIAFKDFFLTELGSDFLLKYYSSILSNKEGIIIGLFDEGELVAFCAATTRSKGFNKRILINNVLIFTIIGIKLIFSKPYALIRLFRNLSKRTVSQQDQGEYAELLSVAVHNNKQNLGIGKKLLIELENQLVKRGIKQLSLTTDYYNNEKAIGFYHTLGYEVMYDFVAYPNRKMYRLIKNI